MPYINKHQSSPLKRDKQTHNKPNDIRQSFDWIELCKCVKKEQKFICANPLHLHDELRLAESVHHIIPLNVAPQYALERSNCIALCNQCHSKVDLLYRQGWQVFDTESIGVQSEPKIG